MLVNDDIDALSSAVSGPVALPDSPEFAEETFAFNGAGTVLTLGYANLPDDRYTLTLRSGDGALEDLVGWDLDCEPRVPAPITQSGDGFEGGDFVIGFDLDVTTAA